MNEFELDPGAPDASGENASLGKAQQGVEANTGLSTKGMDGSRVADEVTLEQRVPLGSEEEETGTESQLVSDSLGEFVELGPTEEDPTAAIRRGMLVDGKKQGLWRVFSEPGVVWMEVEFHEGQRHGLERCFDTEGQVRSENEYRDGALHGGVRYWHSNGVPAIETHYVEGERSGEYRQWNPDGILSHHLMYEDDELDGRCVWFDEDGGIDMDKSGIYVDDERVRPLE